MQARLADFITQLDFDVPGQLFRWSYLSLHSHSVMWWQAAQKSPELQFATSGGPCILVQYIAVSITVC